jgi:hypothetical protein
MNCVLPVVRHLVPTDWLTLTLTEGWSRQPPNVEAIPLVRVPVLHSWLATAPPLERSPKSNQTNRKQERMDTPTCWLDGDRLPP